MSQPKVRSPSSKRSLIKKLFFNGGNVTICLLPSSHSLEIWQVARHRLAFVPFSSIPPFDSFASSLRRRRISSPFLDARYYVSNFINDSAFNELSCRVSSPDSPVFAYLHPVLSRVKNHYCVYMSHPPISSPLCLLQLCFFHFICDLKRTLSSLPLRTLATATRDHQIF